MKRRTAMWLAVGTAVVLTCSWAAVSAQPGDNSDPVVTKSYIDKMIADVKTYVDSKSGSGQGADASSAGVSSRYQVIELSAGQKITLGESTEFILRSGKGDVFSGSLGGIADTTDGVDLVLGQSVPQNHLLIVPRSDGRGMTAKTDCVAMVRGSYQIEK